MFSHQNASGFDPKIFLVYEDHLMAYDRMDGMTYNLAYQLISRNILDNATREAIVFLWEDGSVDSCGILEKLQSKVQNPEISLWLQVAMVRSESYLNIAFQNEERIEGEHFDGIMVMSGLGNFDGMMRILVGFHITDVWGFENKNDRENIDAFLEFAWYHARIESFVLQGDHVLYSLGIDMNHAPADPIEAIITYFNTPSKILFHKYYCNNSQRPEWDYWVTELAAATEKPNL